LQADEIKSQELAKKMIPTPSPVVSKPQPEEQKISAP